MPRHRLQRLGAGLAIGAVLAIAFLRGDASLGAVLGLGVAALVYAGASAVMARLRGAAACMVFGVDGVLTPRGFIPYSKIEMVHHTPAGGRWVIALRLIDGRVLELLATRGLRAGLEDPWGAALARELIAAQAAWSAAQAGPRAKEELVARGSRTGAEWLHALRRLFQGTASAYRGLFQARVPGESIDLLSTLTRRMLADDQAA